MPYIDKAKNLILDTISVVREVYPDSAFYPVIDNPGHNDHKHPAVKDYLPGNKGYKPIPYDKLAQWIEEGKIIGVVPHSIGFNVIDIDQLPGYTPDEWDAFALESKKKNDSLTINELNKYISDQGHVPNFFTFSQTPGHVHLWFKDKTAYQNKKLICGDLRSKNGGIIIWKTQEFATGIDNHIDAENNAIDLGIWLPTKKAIKDYTKGNRNDSLNSAAFKAGILDDHLALEKARFDAREAGLLDDEIEPRATNSYNQGRENARQFLVIDHGVSSYKSIMDKMGIDARYNEFMETIHVYFDKKWQIVTPFLLDVLIGQIREKFYEIAANTGKKKPTIFTHVDIKVAHHTAAHENSINPPIDYLRSLDDNCITDIDCDNFLVMLFGLDDTPYNRAAGRLIALSSVTRLFNKFEKDKATDIKTCVVLQGKGNAGKSTFITLLMPPELQGYVSQNMNLDDDEEKKTEQIDGSIICEIPELSSYSTKKADNIKAFLGRGTDKKRKKYMANAGLYIRTNIFIGTTNNDVFIADDAATQLRFMPIELPVVKRTGKTWIGDFMSKHRDSIWRSAVNLYEQGVFHEMPDEIMDDHQRITKQFSNYDETIIACIEEIYVSSAFGEVKTIRQFAEKAGLMRDREYINKGKVSSAKLAKKMNEDIRFTEVHKTREGQRQFRIGDNL